MFSSLIMAHRYITYLYLFLTRWYFNGCCVPFLPQGALSSHLAQNKMAPFVCVHDLLQTTLDLTRGSWGHIVADY